MFRELAYRTESGWVRRFIPKERYDQVLRRFPAKGAFASAFWYERLVEGPNGRPVPDPRGMLRGDLYFDLDVPREDLRERWEALTQGALALDRWLQTCLGAPEHAIRFYFSGSRGIHVLVSAHVLGNPAHPQLHRVYRQIAKSAQAYLQSTGLDVKLDPIYDRRRLFRLPNTAHEKSGLFKVRLDRAMLGWDLEAIVQWSRVPRDDPEPNLPIQPSQAGRLSVARAIQAIEQQARHYQRKGVRLFKAAVPCIAELQEARIGEGSRNTACAVIASHLLQHGLSHEQARQQLLEWNSEHCEPPLPDTEVLSVVRSIYTHGYTYGCTSIQQLGSCHPDKCPIYSVKATPRRLAI